MAGTATIGWINQTDPDAQAFFNVTGLSDDTQKSAINQLVLDLKSNSLWTKFNAIYPFVGGTSTTHKFNLKDPRDLDAAFRLTFNGGWTHSATGALPDGTTGYADTFLVPNTVQSLDDAHISIYSRTDTAAAARTDIGSSDGTNISRIALKAAGSNCTLALHRNSTSSIANASSACHMLLSRIVSTDVLLIKNGSLLANPGHVSTAKPTLSIFIGGVHSTNPVTYQYSDREYAFATIGSGLTSGEASSLYTIVQAYQTTLGRQV